MYLLPTPPIICADARAIPLRDQSVHCVVTSPPYFGLRSYPDKRQIGLEASPDAYVKRIVQVCREVWRVLRDDGTFWLNLGDSYAGGGYANHKINGSEWYKNANLDKRSTRQQTLKNACLAEGIKAKDLIGIPWRVALALQADGWYLRNDIIWHKPNPMPQSTTDRCTMAHEYLFLFTKQPKYFYDAYAIMESSVQPDRKRADQFGGKKYGADSTWHSNGSVFTGSGTRNKRSVWTVTTQSYKGSHFATFPPKLIEPCVMAGTSEMGVCPICGAPLRRIVAKGAALTDQQAACGANADGGYLGVAQKDYASAKAQDPSAVKARILAGMRERVTQGWRKTCSHAFLVPVPATVFDPFLGSGTTMLVAKRLGRYGVGLDLSYHDLSAKRIRLG